MTPLIVPIPIAALLQAAGVFEKQDPQPQKDWVILPPNGVYLCKMRKDFEPLYAYIDEVQPYDGEVGRYGPDGMKIRVIQQKELKED